VTEAAALAQVVPARPDPAAAGHEAAVAVQHRAIVAVADGAQQGAFTRRRVAAQDGQGLIGVAGQHDGVGGLALAGGPDHAPATTGSVQPLHCLAQTQRARVQRPQHARHVFATAAADRAPLRAGARLQQAVVLEEAQEGRQREVENVGRRRRPDGRRHGQQVMLDEALVETLARQPLAQRAGPRVVERAAGDLRLRGAEEAGDLHGHAPVRRAQQVGRLGEEPGGRAGVFVGALVERDREGHLAGLRAHAQRREESHQVGIVRLVVDDETAVDCDATLGPGDLQRVGMAARARVRVVEHHLMALGQRPGGPEARRAGADHRDLHAAPCFTDLKAASARSRAASCATRRSG